jgi:hypothetical protein
VAIFSGGVLWSDFCSGDIASASGGTAFVDVFTDPNGDGSWLMGDPDILFNPLEFQSANTVSNLRVKCTYYTRANSGNEGLFVDGTNYLSTAIDETGGFLSSSQNWNWYTLPGVTSFNEIKWSKHGVQGSDYNSNSYVIVKGIEVNGQVLLDAPPTPTNAQGVQLGSVTTGLGFHNYMFHFTNGMTSTNTPSFTFSSVADVLSPYVPRDLVSFFAATSVGVPDQYPDRIHKPVRPSGGQQYPRGNRGN